MMEQDVPPTREPDVLVGLRAELELIRRDVRQNDDEIDALQVAAAKTEALRLRPWYKDGSLVIALMALIFSFGTTLASYARLDQEKTDQARNELTGYLQRLGELPRMAAEIQITHGEAASAGVSGYFNAETELIANQALAVMRRIPDRVSTVEYLTVGAALSSTGSLTQADELYMRGLEVAKTPVETITALRFRAAHRFLISDLDGGRELYRAARDVFARSPTEAPALMAQLDAFTEIRWAGDELSAAQCAEAGQHADEAARIMADFPLAVLEPLLAQLRERLERACQTAA